MDDRFMNELRRDPDPKFGRILREKLHAEDAPRAAMGALRPAPALAFALAAAVIVALFAFPSVRVSAQSMLDMFRVRKFAAVQFDATRMDKLHDLKGDQALMVFDTHDKLEEQGPPVSYATLEAGAAAAGVSPLRPTFLPRDMVADSVIVEGSGAVRLSVSEAKLQALLEALDLRDVQVPAGIDGKLIEVHKPKILVQRFIVPGSPRDHGWRAALIQAQSPEVSVPAGLDIQRLGEIGLRILGLDAGEARRVAQATDWRSTMVVPVPLNASTFRQVTVHGQSGLLVTTTGEPEGDRPGRRNGTVVLWTENDRVFGLMTTIPPDDALLMAESVR